MKEDALPFLLGELKNAQSEAHNRLFSWLSRQTGGRIPSDEERELRVFYCFRALGVDAAGALPELREMSREESDTGFAAFLVHMIERDAAHAA
jgi:hypothetical protein